MLRFRNSNRRFTRTTSRSKFAGKRNFRAANDVMYIVRGLRGYVQEDNWEHGITGEDFMKDVDETFKASSIKEVIFKVADFLGIEDKDVEKSLYIGDGMGGGVCQLSVMENADGEPASAGELEEFKRGETVLYIADYSFDIDILNPRVSMEEIIKAFPNSDHD